VLSSAAGGTTIAEQRAASQQALEQDVRKHPLVEAVMERFPGAEIVAVRKRTVAPEAEFEPIPDMPPDPPDDDDRFN
jgi:DNA polymerase-3 subunit gamma/tau